jgi:cystathionine gamma-synthase/methionine-gamma-lyase
VKLLEDRLTPLEHGAGSVAFSSGMGAISALFLSRLSAGDHLVLSDVCYAGVAELAQDILPRFGIAVTPVDTSQNAAVAAALRPGVTRLVHVETPANPILRISDIAALADLAHSAGAELSVDATIGTAQKIREDITIDTGRTILTRFQRRLCRHLRIPGAEWTVHSTCRGRIS